MPIAWNAPSEPTPASDITSACSALVRCASNLKISPPAKSVRFPSFFRKPLRVAWPWPTRYTGSEPLGRPAARPLEISVLALQFGITTDLVFVSTPATPLPASATFCEFGIMRLLPNSRVTFGHWKRAEIRGTFAGLRALPKAHTGTPNSPNEASGKRSCTLLVSITVPKPRWN